MKRLLFLFIPVVAIVAIFTGAITLIKFSPCDTPLTYKIGQIDPKFNISSTDLSKNIETAGKIWSDNYGKQLFSEDTKGELTINLIYDERQSLTSQIGQLKSELDKKDQNLQPQIDQFEARVAKFQGDLAALNREIEEWNNKGGAPADVYERLNKRKEELQAEAKILNSLAKSLNQSTASYNKDINNLNKTIDEFNQTIVSKPEEGLFDPNDNTITIYFASNRNELIHTLAHELGHAIGMEHVDDTKAIMYGFTSQTITPSKEDLDELKYTCRQRSIWQVVYEQIKTINTSQIQTN